MRRGILLIVAALIIEMPALTPAWAEVYSDKIAAVVNGDLILSSEIQKYKEPFVRGFFEQLNLGVVPLGKYPSDKEILDELILIRIMEQEAKQKGLNITEQQVLSQVDQMKKRKNLTHDQFIELLASKGLTFADLKALLKEVLTLVGMLTTEIEQKVPIREEEAQEYFKEHKGEIKQKFKELLDQYSVKPTAAPMPPKPVVPTHEEVRSGGSVKLRQIVLLPQVVNGKPEPDESFMTRLRQVWEELRGGADFAAVARKYSKDPSAKQGGDLGWYKVKDFSPDLQKRVEGLKKGVASNPQRTLPGTQEGAVIYYVEDEKNRTVVNKPIPENLRAERQKQIDAEWERLAEMRKKEEEQARTRSAADDDDDAGPADQKAKEHEAPKDLGILNEEESKQYAKMQRKVHIILRRERVQKRLSEWLNELKKRSIIDVKI